MIYTNRISAIAVICMGSFLAYVVVNNCIKKQINESNKTMSNNDQSGTFTSKDKGGNPVILEWHKTKMSSELFASLMKGIAPIGIKGFQAMQLS